MLRKVGRASARDLSLGVTVMHVHCVFVMGVGNQDFTDNECL